MWLPFVRAWLFLAMGIFFAFGGPPCFAETEEERRDRVERVEQMRHTEEVTGATSRVWSQISKKLGWYIDYGGTTRMTYTGGDEGDHSYSIQDSLEFTKDYELNGFLNLVNLTRTSKFYSRLRTTYTERKKNSNGTRGNDWDQLEVDAMYFERKYAAGPTRTTLTLGRQSVSVGKGIAYAGTGDGIQFRTTYNRGDLFLFGVKADRSPDDIDPGNLSPPSRGHTHREFYGGEFRWNLHPMWSPYMYYVKNRDLNPKVVDAQSSVAQGAFLVHRYQPRFVGYGANGSLIPGLSYFAEVIRAYGTTTSVGDRSDSTQVRAKAYDAGLKYRFTSVFQPSLSIEWAFASGDPDRQSTVNSTLFGNVAGQDNVFRPFGGLGTGYAAAFTFANIHIMKIGGSAMPFANLASPRFRTMRFSADFYNYRKAENAGPVSDFDVPSDRFSKRPLGKELNVEGSWRIWTDMALTVRWGKFMPGGAYDTVNEVTNQQTRARATPEIYWRVQWSLDI